MSYAGLTTAMPNPNMAQPPAIQNGAVQTGQPAPMGGGASPASAIKAKLFGAMQGQQPGQPNPSAIGQPQTADATNIANRMMLAKAMMGNGGGSHASPLGAIGSASSSLPMAMMLNRMGALK